MNLIKLSFLLITLLGSVTAYSQSIFPEKFDGCNTDRFTLESDSITAKVSEEKLFKVLKESFGEKIFLNIRGTLSLQIIVDKGGNSCLLSLNNDTNVRSKKLNLKQTIDGDLEWDKPNKKVAAIIVFSFEDTGIKFKRLGMNGRKGVHELPLE
ncbi:hypothetical protein AB9P05_00010 [Roseivirga sp. BDSF3-8]|uniref:hypothetical protein n=1 Tax=Roseivirga sp. BDSF3-8 TaxID=3241598 RepID=UPI003531DCF2